jgi:hypothetical protein
VAIDYDKAHARIVAAYLKGLTQTYGLRRTEVVTREVDVPGRTYWDSQAAWKDPRGNERIGRFRRGKPQRQVVNVEVPRGVIPEEVLEYANAVAEAHVETLRIIEESFDGKRNRVTGGS